MNNRGLALSLVTLLCAATVSPFPASAQADRPALTDLPWTDDAVQPASPAGIGLPKPAAAPALILDTDVPALAPAAATARPTIGPGVRVLHIGDSHTVGVYGSTIDELMRQTGATVSTYGVAGSSPSWWWNGTVTRCGYSAKDASGKIDRPADWRTPRKTPDFQKLIAETRPDVIVISLGANLIGASESQIKSQCQKLCEMARASGAKIIWVGPPDGREDRKSTARQSRLYKELEKAVTPYATFVDSRPSTEYPETGGDGIHYGGPEGTRRAKAWAHKVLDEIQRPPNP